MKLCWNDSVAKRMQRKLKKHGIFNATVYRHAERGYRLLYRVDHQPTENRGLDMGQHKIVAWRNLNHFITFVKEGRDAFGLERPR